MKYPILGLVENDNMIYIFENDDQFHSTFMELFNDCIQFKVKYIDSRGDIYRVEDVINLGYKGFYGYSLILKGRQIKIKTEFFPVTESINLEDLKIMVIGKIWEKQSFWKESWDIDELINKVTTSITYNQLFLLLK